MTPHHKHTTTHAQAVERVMRKRLQRGAPPESVRAWLEGLLARVYTRPGPERAAVAKFLREFDGLAGERRAVDTLLEVELDTYRKGWQLCGSTDQEKTLLAATIQRIRAILEAK